MVLNWWDVQLQNIRFTNFISYKEFSIESFNRIEEIFKNNFWFYYMHQILVSPEKTKTLLFSAYRDNQTQLPLYVNAWSLPSQC